MRRRRFFLLILLKPGASSDIGSMKRENLPWFLASAVLVAISQAFVYASLAAAPLMVVTPILQLSLVFWLFLSQLINREHEVMNSAVVIGAFTAVVGSILVALDTDELTASLQLPSWFVDFLPTASPVDEGRLASLRSRAAYKCRKSAQVERLQSPTQGLDDAVAFGAGNHQRRAQRDRRAEAPAAAGAADDQPLSRQKSTTPAIWAGIELLLGVAVLHQFDADQQPFAADIADILWSIRLCSPSSK